MAQYPIGFTFVIWIHYLVVNLLLLFLLLFFDVPKHSAMTTRSEQSEKRVESLENLSPRVDVDNTLPKQESSPTNGHSSPKNTEPQRDEEQVERSESTSSSNNNHKNAHLEHEEGNTSTK
jgi:hypothetical protein